MTRLQRLREAIRAEEPARRRRLASYYADAITGKVSQGFLSRGGWTRKRKLDMLCTYYCVFEEPTDEAND